MSRLVMKFGGTSVRDLERIRNAAGRVKREVEAGHEVAVVVSAMAGKTDELIGWVRDAANGPDSTTPFPDGCEYDAVVASGEQVTAGLMALSLQSMGVRARSWLGWQLPVRSTDAHGRARIVEIEIRRLEEGFADGCHAVVSGFQGLGPDQRITTLGRGGSDTSAVALAAALKADRCDIYTDVDGIYTTDPRIVRRAQKLDRIAYEEMLELASLGAKVLHTRSVELAMRYKVRLQVLSSLEDKPGTLVCDEEEIVEEKPVSGIAYSRDEAKITLIRVPDRPGVAAHVFGPLADAGINVDMIVQNISTEGMTDLTFSVAQSELARARQALENAFEPVGYQALDVDDDVCKVSVVGIGMRSHAGIAQKMFAALAGEGINIKVISTSEIKVSVLIGRRYLELAVQALHSAFELDAA